MKIISLVGRVVTVLVLTASLAFAAEDRSVDWGDLVDQSAQTYEDPYRELNADQIKNLRKIIIENAKIEQSGLGGEARALSNARISQAKELLAEDGINADWLIDQRWIVAKRREKAATAANLNLDGKNVMLSGYAIPAPASADGTRIAYLVPERGMCSHMPPPNANQMIRARLTGDWSPSTMHEPVRLTGTLSVEETKHAFRIVDGEVLMRSSYVLDVTGVETIEDLRADTPAVNKWAASIAARLRASGQLNDDEPSGED